MGYHIDLHNVVTIRFAIINNNILREKNQSLNHQQPY